MSDINRVAEIYLREYTFAVSQEERARLCLEVSNICKESDRYEVEEEEVILVSAPVEHFVIFNSDSGRFFYGETPTGRSVFGVKIENAQVFNRKSVEVGELHGVSLPAPWFLNGRAA